MIRIACVSVFWLAGIFQMAAEADIPLSGLRAVAAHDRDWLVSSRSASACFQSNVGIG